MASRRMRLKGVANIAAVNRGGQKTGRSLTPAPSPGLPPSELSNPSFPNSPHSPMKHYPSISSPMSSGERSRHPSNSPRRPEPSPSYAQNSPWSPGLSHSSPSSPAAGYVPHSSESPHSPYFQPIRSESPAPLSQRSPGYSVNEESSRFENSMSPNPRNLEQSNESRSYFAFPNSSEFSPGQRTNVFQNPHGMENVMTNLEREIGAAQVANLNSNETLRQRLQKGTSLNTTKYAVVRKEFLTQYHNLDKPPDKDKLTILHFTFYNPPKKDENVKEEKGLQSENSSMNTSYYSHQHHVDETISISNKTKLGENVKPDIQANVSGTSELETKTRKNVPRVKVGPNGEIMIDEQSLVIQTSDSQRAKKQLAEMETVSGTTFEVGSSGIYRHKKNSSRGRDWSLRETVRFYRALSSCGTDFSMMSQLFPTRSRTELKAKFKREDRKNPAQIGLALSCQTFNLDDGIASSDEELKVKSDSFEKRNSSFLKEATNMEKTNLSPTKLPNSPKSNLPNPHPWEKPSSDEEKSIFDEVEKIPLITVKPSDNVKRKSKNVKSKKPDRKEKDKLDISAENTKAKSKETSEAPLIKLVKPETQVKPVDFAISHPKSVTKRKKIKLKEPKQKTVETEVRPKKSKSVKKTKEVELKADAGDIRPEILRFDPGDPLGYKILASSSKPEPVAVTGTGTILLDAPNCETNPHQIFDLSTLIAKESANSSVHSQEPVTATPNTVVPRKIKAKKRPHPYRVPGPGITPSKSSTVVDEIEIEISCQ